MTPLLYWKFEAELNAAIERLIQRYRNADEKFLVQDGIDYSGAISRQLYSVALNDKWLRRCFITSLERPSRIRFVIASSELGGLARELLRQERGHTVVIIPFPTRRTLIRLVFRFPQMLSALRFLRAIGKKPPAVSEADSSAHTVLCFSHQRKFIGLMRSVVAKLAAPYAFVAGNRQEKSRLGLKDFEVATIPFSKSRSHGLVGKTWPDIYAHGNRLEAALLLYKPKLLLYCEGDAWDQDLVSRLGEKYSIPSVCIQWGAFPYESPRIGFRQLACTAFLTWGDYFSEQLRPYNANTQLFAVGCPSIELKYHSGVRKRMVFLLNTDPKGKAVGLDYFHNQFWQLILWTARSASDWTLTVRAHPSIPLSEQEIEELSAFKNIEIHDPAARTLGESLNDCDLAVTVSSSSVIEAVSCGAVPFIFNPSPWRYQPDFPFSKAGYECKSFEVAIKTMETILCSPEDLLTLRQNLVHFRGTLFADTGEGALENISEVMQALIDKHDEVTSFRALLNTGAEPLQ